jgi:hypothetical protein
MKTWVGVLLAGVLAGCAATSKGGKIDLGAYDVNNTLSDFEFQHAKATIYITTDPPGADVFMDRKYVGKSNEDVVNVLPGQREITLIKDKLYFQKTMVFREGSNRPLDVKLEKAK